MTLKKILITVYLNLSIGFVFAQKISLGDQFPELKFDSVVGNYYEAVNIPGGQEKLLILDFWSTGCSTCIKDFRKLDSIEQLFNGQVKIVSINDQGLTVNEVRRFWDSNKILSTSGRGSVVDNNQVLRKMFPRLGVPYFLFIDSKGRYRGKGGYEYFSETTIRKIFEDTTFVFDAGPPKTFFTIESNFFGNRPSFSFFPNYIGQYRFGPYNELYFSDVIELKVGSSVSKTIQFINFSIQEAYEYCFNYIDNSNNVKKLNFEMDDSLYSAKFRGKDVFESDWNRSHRFCAEFKFNSNISNEKLASTIIGALDEFFGNKTNIKSRIISKDNKKKPAD